MSLLWLYSKKEINENFEKWYKKGINEGREIAKRDLLWTLVFSWKSLKDIVSDNIDYFSWLSESERYKIIDKIFWENIPQEGDENFAILKALDYYEISRIKCGYNSSIDCCPSWCPEYGRGCRWSGREIRHNFF